MSYSERVCGVALKRGGSCQMREGHYADPRDIEKGHGKPAYWRKPELCPDRAKHASEVYGDRMEVRYGNVMRDGVMTHWHIDGKQAAAHYKQELCICDLYVIWTPKQTARKGS